MIPFLETKPHPGRSACMECITFWLDWATQHPQQGGEGSNLIMYCWLEHPGSLHDTVPLSEPPHPFKGSTAVFPVRSFQTCSPPCQLGPRDCDGSVNSAYCPFPCGCLPPGHSSINGLFWSFPLVCFLAMVSDSLTSPSRMNLPNGMSVP